MTPQKGTAHARKTARQERDQSRRDRVAQIEREHRRRERRARLLLWSVVGLVLLGIAGGVAWGVRQQGQRLADVKTYTGLSANHVTTPVKYAQSPPTGGNHNPVWLNCGTYTKPIPNENAVHSMEHGATWVTYDPKLRAKDVETLAGKMPDSYAILSPSTSLKGGAIYASAWGKQLRVSGAGDSRLDDFLTKYTQGEQAPEPGASCSGGSDGTLPLTAGGGMSK